MAAPKKKKSAKKSPLRVRESVSLYDAKTNLSELVDRAAAGEEFTIAKSGKPMAKLVPLVDEAKRALRVPGQHKIWMSDDWDAPMTAEELALWGIDSK